MRETLQQYQIYILWTILPLSQLSGQLIVQGTRENPVRLGGIGTQSWKGITFEAGRGKLLLKFWRMIV